MTQAGQVIKTIRDENIVLPAQVNYGITDGLVPPYVNVGEWKSTWDRDTQNGVRETTFFVLCVAKNVDDAEDLASKVDTLLDKNYNVTDQDIGLLQESYELGQTDPNNLYQYGVKMGYRLFTDPNK